MSNQAGNAKRRVVWAERRAKAVALRRVGATYSQIGNELGITRARAHQIVQDELRTLAEETRKDAGVLRELEIQRLDRALVKVFAKVEDGDLEAVRTLLKISERRAKLLGLDAPTLVEDVTPAKDSKLLSVTIGGERVKELLALDGEDFATRVPDGKEPWSSC